MLQCRTKKGDQVSFNAVRTVERPEPRTSRLRAWTRPPTTFTLIALLFGTCLVLLIPPFQGADEPYHFLRAYQVTEGELVDHQQDVRGYAGGYLPESLYNVWLPFSKIGFHPSIKASLGQIRGAMHIPLRPDDRIFITFPNTAHYCPTGYLPQCAGILLGRILRLPPLAMLYLGREANLLVWTALGYGSLRLAPAIARPMLILLLMPMSLWVAATFSADPVTNGLASLFTALICNFFIAEPGSLKGKSVALLLLITLPLSISKLVYMPLLALLLLIPCRNFGRPQKRLAAIGLILAINFAVWAGWVRASSGLDTRISISRIVSPHAQLDQLEQNPGRAPQLVLRTLEKRGRSYLQSYVGLIGWFDLYLPSAFVAAYLVLLTFACWVSQDSPALPSPGRAASVVLPAVLISISSIALLSYLYWSPVGFDFIDGIHGRYLIPLTPAIFVLLCSTLRFIPARFRLFLESHTINLLLATFVLASSSYFLVMVWARYYGWIRGESPLFR
jgi:uncharacterized membrane protein